MIKQSNQKSLHYKTCSKLAMNAYADAIYISSLKFCNFPFFPNHSILHNIKNFYISSLKFQLCGFINNKCSEITHNLSFENR